MELVSDDQAFKTLKVSPLLNWNDQQMMEYCKQNDLPVEWDYFDPAKADEKRECGLHASWGSKAVASQG